MDAFPDALGALIALFLWLKLINGFAYTIDIDDDRMTIGLDTGVVAEQVAEAALFGLRAGARVEYESVAYDPRADALTISGLLIDAGQGPARVDRIDITGVADDQPIDLRVAFQGLDAPIESLDLPLPAQIQVAMFGLDRLAGDGALDIAYVMETSDATIDGEIDLAGAGRVRLEADVAGLRLAKGPDTPLDGEVTRFALAFENRGALEQVGPTLGVDPDDPAASKEIAAMLARQMVDVLSDGAPPHATFLETAEAVETALTRFFAEGDAIAITIDPTPPLAFVELENMSDLTYSVNDRAALLERFNLALAATPRSTTPVVATLPLPEGASAAERLRVAEALRSGLGAPRDLDLALEILAPAAADGDPQAASATAVILLERGRERDIGAAYALTLLAMTADIDGASARAAALAARLPADGLLEAEATARDRFPDATAALRDLRADAEEGDVAAMRRLAVAFDAGVLTLRDTRAAYRWALLAAAGGDRAAARLRDRLASRFAHGDDDDRSVWDTMIAEEAAAATALWRDGLAAKVAARE